jgi:hypothetical protein
MHNFIAKNTTGPQHFDVSPHFLTQELWDSFFQLVDTHTHINASNIWKPPVKYTGVAGEIEVTPSVGEGVTQEMTNHVLKSSQALGIAAARAAMRARASRKETNSEAGARAEGQSKAISQEVADTYYNMQQSEDMALDCPSARAPASLFVSLRDALARIAALAAAIPSA